MLSEKNNSLTEDENVEQVKKFVYLVKMFAKDRKYEKDIERRATGGS